MSNRTTWNFYTAGRLIFGRGAVHEIGGAVAREAVCRVMIVTDTTLIEVGVCDRVRGSLAAAGLEVGIFDGGEAEPSIDIVQRCTEFAREFCPEVIVGVGGGSNLDLSKMTAVLLTHGGQPSDYFGYDTVPGPVCRLVCVPTTSGTGSEVSHAAVLTDTENEIKVSTLSPYLRPRLAVVDPELTLTCPRQTTVDSGIDALTHAIEAYTAIDYSQLDIPAGDGCPYDGRNPLTDCLAEKAIQLISQHLVAAVSEPNNPDAREGMALAATMAGMAFSNAGVAIVHALEYPLGGALHCSHGAGNGMLLPYVMRYNLPVRAAALSRIAQLMGEEINGLSSESAAERAIEAVIHLRQDIGVPHRIREFGGTAEQLPGFAAKSFAIQRLMSLNPRVPTEKDLLGILREAL